MLFLEQSVGPIVNEIPIRLINDQYNIMFSRQVVPFLQFRRRIHSSSRVVRCDKDDHPRFGTVRAGAISPQCPGHLKGSPSGRYRGFETRLWLAWDPYRLDRLQGKGHGVVEISGQWEKDG